jgi:xanthine dehydrogenase molybdopterin-binding subunit B
MSYISKNTFRILIFDEIYFLYLIYILVSTQNPTETQECVAHALGVPMNKIVCRVKRMGGGFGGKESRNIPFSLVNIK